jgi:hypothetical protein
MNWTRNILTMLDAFSSVLFKNLWKDDRDTSTLTITPLRTEIPIAVDYAKALLREYPSTQGEHNFSLFGNLISFAAN